MSRRPNIVFITSDQHRGDCFGFEGRAVKTPHLDELARAGTRFDACITPSVVCQPARAAILTGQLPRTNGVHDNGIDLETAVGEKGFAGSLAAAGYETAFIGKAHFSTYHTFEPTGRPECIKSSASYGDDWYGPYMGFQHVELMMIGHNWFLPPKPPEGLHYERWFYADGQGERKNGLYGCRLEPDVGAAQTWHSALPVAWHNSTWTGDRAVEYIKGEHEKPFCLWVSLPDPHHPFDAPEPWSRMHDPLLVDLPVHRARDLEQRPWWHRAAIETKPKGTAEVVATRQAYSRVEPQSDLQLRHMIANYYGMISLVDHQVGRILIALEEAGIADDTLVVFSSDHGEMLGDHGLVLKGPMHYEGVLRVGMIVRGPGVPAGKRVADPVSTLDLAPTFSDYAGAPPLHNYHGHSLRPLIETDSASRDCALNEWELLPSRVGVPLSLRTVRTRRHKLTLEAVSGAGELYDLENDPHEMNNLFDDPAAASVRRELEAMLQNRPDDMRPELSIPVGTA
ncbi:sulfatase-like hydrolase/transferase [Marinobacterium rhizophilum]|uniref:Sulfatase-like hydrolase/transferase n=1 Tax=Marinobacterium rhizophilum TaxID=420402 RepID=A0ABY5HJH2_9GAMM|nr:sulfatase-like hydrolase/transferase [Marinobacterium rhizophilum]UTW11405.1 sulfatase-like hydrolase/transferase [Marinobacterium rhizophilum]